MMISWSLFALACMFACIAFVFSAILSGDPVYKDAQEVRSFAWLALAASAVAKYLGLAVLLCLVACSNYVDHVKRKAKEMNVKRPVIVCGEGFVKGKKECTISGDNFSGWITVRCGWMSCEEVPPLTK